MKFTKRGNQRNAANPDPNLSGEIETFILKRSSTETIALQRLVRELSRELTCQPDKVISEIIKLQAQKKILIREPTPYKTLRQYLLSPLSLWFWEPVIVTVLSLALLITSAGLGLYFRFVFGGILVLFLPGYSLVGLLYSKRVELDYLSRIAVSFVMSLAIAILVGLVLGYTPFGITSIAVGLSLGGLTIALLFLTVLRKHAYYRLTRGTATQ